jgi:phosphopantetheinyl transferase
LIRHVLQELCGVESDSPVLSDTRGAPVPSAPIGWHVSLAHDGDIFVAAASRHPVGIDVVDDARLEQVHRVVRRAFDTDRAPRPALPSDTMSRLGLTLEAACWTAWEALGKETGLGLSTQLVRWPWETGAAEGEPSDMPILCVRRPDGTRVRLVWGRVPGASVGCAIGGLEKIDTAAE